MPTLHYRKHATQNTNDLGELLPEEVVACATGWCVSPGGGFHLIRPPGGDSSLLTLFLPRRATGRDAPHAAPGRAGAEIVDFRAKYLESLPLIARCPRPDRPERR